MKTFSLKTFLRIALLGFVLAAGFATKAFALSTTMSTTNYGEQGYYSCHGGYVWVFNDETHQWDYVWCWDCECDWVHEYYWYEKTVQITGSNNTCAVQLVVTFSNSGQQTFNYTSNGNTIYQVIYYTSSDAYPVSASATENCPSVTAIIGLPDVVCVGEDYQVTAQSAWGSLSALQWFGDAQIISQSGNNAVVRFTSSGSNPQVKAKNNVGSNPPQVAAATTAVTVTYAIPSRGSGLPVSIPYNINTNIGVSISPSVGTKSLRFKIIGSGGNNGSAAIQGSADLQGSGGTLVVKGTGLTAVGSSGNISIRTDTKPASTCGPSAGFSVCAHPTGNYVSSTSAIYNPNGLRANHRWNSDSGDRAHLDEVYVKEDVSFLQGATGCFTHVTALPLTSDFIRASQTQPDDHKTFNDTTLINLFNNYGGGTYEDNQFERFYCARCGMTESSAVIVPNAGFKVMWSLSRPSGTQIDLTVQKVGAAMGGSAAGTVPASPGNSATHTIQP